MYILARNVNDSYDALVRICHRDNLDMKSAGTIHYPHVEINSGVWRSHLPINILYARSVDAILLCPVRDINPFLYLMYGLKSLVYPCNRLAETDHAIQQLKDSKSKSTILYSTVTKHPVVTFKIRRSNLLDLTAFNANVDLLDIGLGLEYVQLSFLHRYIANALECDLGVMTHILSNPFVDLSSMWWKNISYQLALNPNRTADDSQIYDGLGNRHWIKFFHNMKEKNRFTSDLQLLAKDQTNRNGYTSLYFKHCVVPLLDAFHYYQNGQNLLAELISNDACLSDWCIACQKWIERHPADKKI